MRMLIHLLLMLSVSTFVSACQKKGSEPGSGSEHVKKLEALADQGCACKDKACADKVISEVQALARSITKLDDKDRQPMQAAQARLDACLVKYNPFIASYQKLTEEVCACKDKACAARSAKKFSRWAAKLKSSGKRINAADLAVFKEQGQKAAKCFARHGVPIPQ